MPEAVRVSGGGRHVRAADVARLAQVSVSTVSLVVNGKYEGRVSTVNRRRVMEAVEALGYEVDTVGRSLATGRAGTISLLVPDLDSPFFAHVTEGAHHALEPETQLSLSITGRDPEAMARGLERALSSRIDGLLCHGVVDDALRAHAVHAPFPVVMMDDPTPGWPGPAVEFDIPGGAIALVQHLVDLGHRRIAYLAPTAVAASFQLRQQVVTAELQRGHALPPPLIVTSNTTADDSDRAITRSWHTLEEREITALVCATDVQAYGSFRALRRLGVPIPGRLSVASFDDLPTATVLSPTLTAVRLPARELGATAARALVEALEAGRVEPDRRLVPTRLHVRGSTAPPGPTPGSL